MSMSSMAEVENLQEDDHQQKNKGKKRKRAIEEITDKTKRHITFSKRRAGLFKKASELCSITGSEIAIITFSGAGKLFSFGGPSVDGVIHRYLNSSKQDEEVLNSSINGGVNNNCGFWWNEPIDDDLGLGLGLGLVELEKLKAELEKLRNQVASRIDEINNWMNFDPQNFDYGLIDGNNIVAQALDYHRLSSTSGSLYDMLLQN